MDEIKCSNLYTLNASAGGAYKLVFPSGGSVSVGNDTTGIVTLRLDGSQSNNEKLVIPAGEAFNDLSVPAGRIYIATAAGGTVGIVFRG